MSRCPTCDTWLPPEANRCSGCGTTIALAPIVEDVPPLLEPEPEQPRRRRLRKLDHDEPELPFGGAFQSWGLIAGIIVYIPSAILLGWFVIANISQMRPGPGIIYFIFGGALIPAGIAWMIVDSLQATYNWWTDPRQGPDRPLINLLAGPIRLSVITLCPLGGAGLGPLIHPQSVEWALLIGGLVGAIPGLLAALVISLIIKAM